MKKKVFILFLLFSFYSIFITALALDDSYECDGCYTKYYRHIEITEWTSESSDDYTFDNPSETPPIYSEEILKQLREEITCFDGFCIWNPPDSI